MKNNFFFKPLVYSLFSVGFVAAALPPPVAEQEERHNRILSLLQKAEVLLLQQVPGGRIFEEDGYLGLPAPVKEGDKFALTAILATIQAVECTFGQGTIVPPAIEQARERLVVMLRRLIERGINVSVEDFQRVKYVMKKSFEQYNRPLARIFLTSRDDEQLVRVMHLIDANNDMREQLERLTDQHSVELLRLLRMGRHLHQVYEDDEDGPAVAAVPAGGEGPGDYGAGEGYGGG